MPLKRENENGPDVAPVEPEKDATADTGDAQEEIGPVKGSFAPPDKPVQEVADSDEEDLTVGDLLPRRIITIQDVGKTAADIFNEVKEDGVQDHTKLTKQEEAILHDMLFGQYASMQFKISDLYFTLRTISSEMSIVSERYLAKLVGDRAKSRDITTQELTVINSRLTLARYLASFGTDSFDSSDFESEAEFELRYEYVKKLSVAVLDHCNMMVQRFVSIQNKVLAAETLINF